jgi:hypothetical protein
MDERTNRREVIKRLKYSISSLHGDEDLYYDALGDEIV